MSLIYKHISESDIDITSTPVYKQWAISSESFDSYGIKVFRGKFNAAPFDSTEASTSGTYDRAMWHSIKNVFSTTPLVNDNEYRALYGSCIVISIPMELCGEGIRPGSVVLYGSLGSGVVEGVDVVTIAFGDDSNGNLWGYPGIGRYATGLSTELIDDGESINNGMYADGTLLKFNFSNDTVHVGKSSVSGPISNDGLYKFNSQGYNLAFKTSSIQYPSPIQCNYTVASFNGSSSFIEVSDSSINTGLSFPSLNKVNFTNHEDFTVSAWIELPSEQLDLNHTSNVIFCKRGLGYKQTMNSVGQLTTTKIPCNGKYPFQISVYNSGANKRKISVSRYDGVVLTELTSSAISSESLHNVTAVKDGNQFLFYLDGTLVNSATIPTDRDTHNDAHIYVGQSGNDSQFFSGSIANCMIFNTPLAAGEISEYLINNVMNTPYSGNILYKKGLIVITDPCFDHLSLNDDFNLTLGFDSTVTINECSVACSISDKDFNVSQNPTILDNTANYPGQVKSFVTSSEFQPYITTVGLYNDNNELLMVGKLAQPIIKLANMDTTVVLRFDY